MHTDRLGAPQAVTNSSQAVVWKGSYDPFDNTTTVGGITQNLRLPGQVASSLGAPFLRNGLRDYATAYGRYMEPDPIGLNGGVNPYVYVNGNPTNYVDTKGTCVEDLCLGEVFLVFTGLQDIEAGSAIATIGEAAWTRASMYACRGINMVNQNRWLSTIFGYGTVAAGAEEVPGVYSKRAEIWSQYGAMAAKIEDAYGMYEETHGEYSSAPATPEGLNSMDGRITSPLPYTPIPGNSSLTLTLHLQP